MSINQWVDFPHPELSGWVWRIDVSLMVSHYGCIYGRGCKGTTSVPEFGCCAIGFSHTDHQDAARMDRHVAKLKDEEWQYHQYRKNWWEKKDEETNGGKIVDGACVFLNRADHPNGPGCALHQAALKRGKNPVNWKPDICNMVPLHVDAFNEQRVTTLGRYHSYDWRADKNPDALFLFDWWCGCDNEDNTAWDNDNMLVITMADTIIKILGKDIYAKLTDYIRSNMGNVEPAQPEVMVALTRKGRVVKE